MISPPKKQGPLHPITPLCPNAPHRTQPGVLDSLTGFLTRSAFLEVTKEALRNCGENPPCLTIVHFEGLKEASRKFGALTRDALVASLAQRMRKMAPGVILARLAGERFGILSDGSSAPEREMLVESVDNLRALAAERGVDLNIRFSLGYLPPSEQELTAQDYLARAETGTLGANAVSNLTVSSCRDCPDRSQCGDLAVLDRPIRLALESSLDLTYQPIVDTVAGTTVGIQAIARLNSGAGDGSIGIGLTAKAERLGQDEGVIPALTERALRECPAWKFGGCLFIAINGRDLVAPKTVDSLLGIITRTGAPAEHIVLEITEPYATYAHNTSEIIEKFRRIGVRFAVNYSGTREKILAGIDPGQVDVLKVGSALVDHLADDARTATEVSSILELSRRLNMDCVLEGIETPAQALQARLIGARFMQGYHFVRPGTFKEALALLPKALARIRKQN